MLKYTSFAAVTALYLAAVACSSGGPSGQAPLPSSFPSTGLFTKGTGASKGMVVVLSDDAGTCDDLGQNVKRKGEALITLTLAASDPNGTPLADLPTGTYPVAPDFDSLQPGSSALVFGLSQYDNTCNAAERFADSGSVTLSTITLQSVVGSYDVMLGGLHYTGQFLTAYCDPTANLAPGTATPQCQ